MATSSLLLNCTRHSGHLLPSYCTASATAFLPGGVCCGWTAGAEVLTLGVEEDNGPAEEVTEEELGRTKKADFTMTTTRIYSHTTLQYRGGNHRVPHDTIHDTWPAIVILQ